MALLLHVARIAHERGCGRFEWPALDWNTPAIDFYQSLGAVALDDWTIFRVTGGGAGEARQLTLAGARRSRSQPMSSTKRGRSD
jgi:hypothetical protein